MSISFFPFTLREQSTVRYLKKKSQTRRPKNRKRSRRGGWYGPEVTTPATPLSTLNRVRPDYFGTNGHIIHLLGPVERKRRTGVTRDKYFIPNITDTTPNSFHCIHFEEPVTDRVYPGPWLSQTK